MSIVTEHFHEKRLNSFHLNIKTKFQDGDKVCERNSDNSYQEDIQRGVILNKTYFKDHVPIHMEKVFNPSMLYSFVMNRELETEISCANCGMVGKGKDFLNGCPYCGSIYTIDYTEKNTGAKLHRDYVMRENQYKVKTYILDLIVCLVLSSLYCLSTGRTFTIFDVMKILGIALIGSLVLFYPFYVVDAYLVTNRVKREKEKQNQKQMKFWNEMEQYHISKEKFFNNLNNELNEYFYDDMVEENKNVIDFDPIEYEEYEYWIDDSQRVNIKVTMDVRIVEMNGNKIDSKEKKLKLILVQNEMKENEYQAGISMIKCHGCGASIDIMKNKCDYCGAKIHYLQRWYIHNIEVVR